MIGVATRIPRGTLSNIQGKAPEQVLALGDYSYQSTATCWLNIINPIKSKTHIAIGNHENDADEGNSAYMNAFGLSNQYYSFDYQYVHVLTMATEISFGSGSSQYNFVKSDLQACCREPKHQVDNCKLPQSNVYVTQYLLSIDMPRQSVSKGCIPASF